MSAYKTRLVILKYLLVLVLLFITACNKQGDSIIDPDPEVPTSERGTIVGSPKFWMETPPTLAHNIADVLQIDKSIVGNYTVRVYSITYKTIDKKGNLINASGTIYYPIGNEEFPMLSYHHGTEFHRSHVASVDPLANQQESFIIASNGYITLVPDYLGFGVSNMIHPYHLKDLSASCVIDFLRAGKKFCETNNVKLNGKLFLGGYSEGGFVTMAVHKEIETNLSDEFTVTASAPLAGAYDLIATGKDYFYKTVISRPAFLGFLLTAYNDVYEWNKIDSIFNQPYAAKMNTLYDGTHIDQDISANLNDTVNVLVKQSFIDSFLSETTTPEKVKFVENSLLDWRPIAPMQMVHGDADDVVPYINATNAYNAFKNKGAVNVSLLTVPGGNHATTILPAVIYSLEFFKNYR